MAHTLPDLPFGPTDLEPFLSSETLDYHHGKHHKAYVDNLNRLTTSTPQEGASLEELIRTADGGVFNNAAQVWNHTFYWRGLKAGGGGSPGRDVLDAINGAFGSLDALREAFNTHAAARFGSGWAWLVQRPDGTLAVTTTANADNPLRHGDTPLLTCDVWEHAYYIDYRNARPKYLDQFWSWINWDFVAANLAG
ncbi:MAG: superoxide dismutase [Holophagae bacterium]|jgi:Fe-Mn family superoxide dismutase